MSGEGRIEEIGELRLAPESVEDLACRIAELLRPATQPQGDTAPRRLLSAAEVAEWWGVEREWVYAHAEELGARRLGAGRRPRLRFDPDEVAERIKAIGAPDALAGGRSAAIAGDPPLARFRAPAELSSPSKENKRPGGAPTPPARRRRRCFGA